MDGILTKKDALAYWTLFKSSFGPETQLLSGRAKRSGQSTACLMPMRGVTSTSLARKSIVAQLQRRLGIEQIEAIVAQARETQRLAKAAGAGGELAWRARLVQFRDSRHLRRDSVDRFQRAQQDASGLAFGSQVTFMQK